MLARLLARAVASLLVLAVALLAAEALLASVQQDLTPIAQALDFPARLEEITDALKAPL